MSLEQTLERIAVAIEKIAAGQPATNLPAPSVPTRTPIDPAGAPPATPPAMPPRGPGRPRSAPAAVAPAAAVNATSAPARVPAAQPAAPAPAAPAEPGAVKYDDCRKVVLAHAEKHGHKATLAILAQFGVTNAKEAKPDQWGAIIQAIETAGAPSVA